MGEWRPEAVAPPTLSENVPSLERIRAERDGSPPSLIELTTRTVRAERAAETLARAIESADVERMAAALVAYRARPR